MEGPDVGGLLRHLRRLVGAEEPTDHQLLERYLAGDADAFRRLVGRHGPLVLGVCRRLLRHEHDAEDAFQAVFLVLATRAHTIRRAGSLSSFLHGVALRVARKARARRRERVGSVPDRPAPESAALQQAELAAILDAEIARMPEWCRAPLVPYHLQGVSVREVGRRLGLPRGTVLSRLARARQRLAEQVRRRGFELPSLGLAVLRWTDPPPAQMAAAAVEAATRVLAGEAVAQVVTAQILELTREGGKMSKTILYAGIVTVVSLGLFPLGPQTAVPPAPPVVQAAAPPKRAGSPEESRLDVVLRQWAKATEARESGRLSFTRTEHDRAFGTRTQTRGTVQFLRPDLVRVDEERDHKPADIFLFSKGSVSWFNGKDRTEWRFSSQDLEGLREWPALREGIQQFTWWYPGWVPVGDLAKLYNVQLHKEDAYYIYLDLRPRNKESWAVSKRVRVVLMRDGLWLRQLWKQQPNDNEITWDFQRPDTGARITPASLREGLERGWKQIGKAKP